MDRDGEEWEAPREAYWDNPVAGLWGGGTPALSDACLHAAANTGLPHLWLMLQHAERSTAVLGGQEFQLEAGDMALSLLESVPRVMPRSWQQRHFLFPLEGASAHREKVVGRLPAVLPGTCPATALLGHFAQCLHASAENLPPGLKRQLQERLLDMLDDALLARDEVAAEAQHPDLGHAHHIKAYLCAHLREPDLTVKKAAEALGLSVSHVYRVFMQEGRTVAEWLWSRRLEGCAADLSSPALSQLAVGKIAMSWGFNAPSHFSHAFKKRFGLSPKEWRKQASLSWAKGGA